MAQVFDKSHCPVCFCGIVVAGRKHEPAGLVVLQFRITEVETAIENRIAELEKEYELDIYDRNDIREEEYQKAGWRHDPFPEELEEEDEEEKEDWHYHSMEERLNEVGMSMRDFF